MDFDVAVLDILNKNNSTQAFHHKIEYLLSNRAGRFYFAFI